MSVPLSLQVNNVDFQNIVREEAVLFLLEITRGEEVCILAQRKKDGEQNGQGVEAFRATFHECNCYSNHWIH